MANAEQKNEMKSGGKKTGQLARLGILLGVFVVAAGGIYGYQEYLKSQVPKGDKNFVKEGSEEPETPQSNMEILNDIFSGSKPSQEITDLKSKSAEEVVYTYDQIMKMSPDELEKNINELAERLRKKRASLPPSISGASAGGTNEQPDKGADDGPVDDATIPSLALPLEVMRQVAKSKKQ